MKRFFKVMCLVFAMVTFSLTFSGCGHLKTGWKVRQNISSGFSQMERLEYAVLHNEFSTSERSIKEIWINVDTSKYKSVTIDFDFGTSSTSFTRKNVEVTYTNFDVKKAKDGWICVSNSLNIAYNYVKVSLDYAITVYEVVFVLDNATLPKTKFIGQQIWLNDKYSDYLTADQVKEQNIKNSGANLIDEQGKFKVSKNSSTSKSA